MKKSAQQAFEQTGYPTRKLENWKYSALNRRVPKEGLPIISSSDDSHSSSRGLTAGSSELQLTFNGGQLITNLNTLSLPEGLSIRVLEEPEYEQHLKTDFDAKRHPMAVLNTAICTAVVLIEVADNARIEQPLRIYQEALPNGWNTHRLIFNCGKHSELTVVHDALSTTDAWLNTLDQAHLSEGAAFKHFTLQREQALNHIQAIHVTQESNSFCEHFVMAMGSNFARVDFEVDLVGEGSSCSSRGGYCVTGKSHFDVHSQINHLASHTTSNVLFKGLVDDQAHAVFNTKAIAAKDKKAIVAHQNNRNLLLSSQAEVDTKPELEIYTDDVECTHGATVGQLDEGAVFYLQSRGIDEADARQMLTRSFLSELCLGEESICQELHGHLQAKLERHFGENS